MKKSKKTNKIGIILLGIILILCIVLGLNVDKKSQRHFAIIPHFMLDSEKVDQFYNFIKNEYYSDNGPNTILLISPNHFHTEETEIKTICENAVVNYGKHNVNILASLAELGVKCDEKGELFYKWGDGLQTSEHGIGEHFQWINKYFPEAKVIPIISPCFQLSTVKNILPKIKSLNGNILVIASVDFAHYQNEEQTLQHDEKSIETLKSMTLNESEFMESIDSDCHACLFMIQSLANKKGQKAEFRYRDSSSTILNQDMGAENTSRIFMWYE